MSYPLALEKKTVGHQDTLIIFFPNCLVCFARIWIRIWLHCDKRTTFGLQYGKNDSFMKTIQC